MARVQIGARREFAPGPPFMRLAAAPGSNLAGAFCAMFAMMCFSVIDVGAKFLSDTYALHQITFIRSCLAISLFMMFIMPFNGWLAVFRTRRPGAHLLRGACVIVANTFLFLGLAALPIADATAIFFVSPLLIALFSIIFLGEKVGPRRWAAIMVGFMGVLFIVKPGTSAFQFAALFPMVAATLYAAMSIIARRIRHTESAPTMAIYVQIVFFTSSLASLAVIGDGRFSESTDHASFLFLLRAWAPVEGHDWPLLMLLGLCGLLGNVFISQAFRLSEAAFAAPFEYVSMLMAIVWGVTVFGTWPDTSAWIGIAFILGSGIYLVFREGRRESEVNPDLKLRR
ncbi:MAG: DMT family transporter [Roseovarius sp.]|nr:DMT family transporter [Roseovarius sp.]